MDPRTKRRTRNETAHRELNERMAEYDTAAGFASLPLDFVCECCRDDCRAHLGLSADTWQRLHLDGDLFVVAPEHVDPQIEDVVLRTSVFWQVRKRGDAGRMARDQAVNGSKS